MLLTPRETEQVLTAIRGLSLEAPAERLEEFITRILGFNAIQQEQHFPSPDPQGFLAIAIGDLTQARETILRRDCTIPNFAIYDNFRGVPQVAGFLTYLASKGFDAQFQGRLAKHGEIRTALRALERGQHLEALAAAILNQHCGHGEATRGSGDQGIDAIGSRELLMIDGSFSEGGLSTPQRFPGEKVFLLASSKAVIGAGRGTPKLLNPAHIRDLVGGWVIQRSTAAIWQESGIRMLSPVQMILVTTYRLSIESKSLCRTLGVQVWSIPELIYLICKWAPAEVFDAADGYSFQAAGFRSWWKERDQNRLMAA